MALRDKDGKFLNTRPQILPGAERIIRNRQSLGIPTPNINSNIMPPSQLRTKRYAWDRIAGESSQAYEAFCLYRDLDPAVRSVAKVKEVGNPFASEWSFKYNWLTRSLAYDDWLERKFRNKLELQKLEMKIRQSRLGKRMQDIAMTSLGVNPETGEFTGDQYIQPESIGEVVKLADVGTRIERLALGEQIGAQDNSITFNYNGPLPSWAQPIAGELESAKSEREGLILEGDTEDLIKDEGGGGENIPDENQDEAGPARAAD